MKEASVFWEPPDSVRVTDEPPPEKVVTVSAITRWSTEEEASTIRRTASITRDFVANRATIMG
jgi:hypothetical protein